MTDELIARAQAVVLGTNNAQAQLELDAATRLQTQAKTEFAAGHFLMAYDLTSRARTRAGAAIALVRGLPDPDRVLAQLERTGDMLDRTKEHTEECDNERARAVLRAAFDMQARAQAAATEGRYLAALQLTMSARERALRALRLCNQEDNLHDAAERALSRTDEILSHAKDTVADRTGDAARQALDRAVASQNEAWVQFRAEHDEASLNLTQLARTSARRALRLAGGR
jgi:hypothetical protein